jgi:hypothetical protein
MQEERERREEERARIQEQRDIYDKYVKEMHWPKVSEKKKQELEQLKMTLKTSPAAKKSPKSIMGQSTRGDVISHHGKGGRAASENNEENSQMKSRMIIWPDNPLKPKPKEKKEGKIVDWLREQRIKHEEDVKNGIVSPQ